MVFNIKKSRTENLAVLLEEAAVQYLARYAATEASLRKFLRKNLRRKLVGQNTLLSDQDQYKDYLNKIDNIITRLIKSGALNDENFSTGKILTYRRKGLSRNAIQQSLKKKGVKDGVIKKVLLVEKEEGDDPQEAELKAAHRLAQRRKLGPYHIKEATAINNRKELMIMLRAGYSLAMARQVLQSKGPLKDEI